MTGWIADFFRFWWALAYWNSRKTWFRLRGAHRDSCPCQNFSDSGLAFDSHCAAVASWHNPRRFRKVCPLLTETKQGWRCGADAERVRPFWFRALAYGGAALLGLYLLGTVALYATLRTKGYPVDYLTVMWPPRWAELRHSQELLHTTRAQQAMNAGDNASAILSLQTVRLLNPRNLDAALTLARLLQLTGQASAADLLYARLMQDIPEQRPAIAQVWVRLLLARAHYPAIKPLALAMLSEDSSHREAWLKALLFAARQSNDPAALDSLLTGEHGVPNWCVEIAGTEQILLQRQPERALSRLVRVQPAAQSSYVPSYQADRLLRLGQTELAANLLTAYGEAALPADEAAFLRLRTLRAQGSISRAESEFERLLRGPLTPRLAILCSAHLVEWPDRDYAVRFGKHFLVAGPPLSPETLPVYQAVLLAVASSGATDQAGALAAQINPFMKSDGQTLHELAALLQSGASPDTLAQLLPAAALPLDVIYAVHSRIPAPAKS